MDNEAAVTNIIGRGNLKLLADASQDIRGGIPPPWELPMILGFETEPASLCSIEGPKISTIELSTTGQRAGSGRFSRKDWDRREVSRLMDGVEQLHGSTTSRWFGLRDEAIFRELVGWSGV